MRVVQINSTCGSGSTGKICLSISKLLTEQNVDNYILYSVGKSNYKFAMKYGSFLKQKIQALFTRIFGNNGFAARGTTRKLISFLKKINPDIVHLHNLHSNDINLPMLFDYLRNSNIKVFYTFHDCWAFTGYCTHFSFEGCDGYKNGCSKCPTRKKYSWFFDKSSILQRQKVSLIIRSNTTIITPSFWLARIVEESFLKPLTIKTINNGIDLSLFCYRESNFRENHAIPKEGKVLLGVSFGWGYKKGLDIFIRLSKELPSNYYIVLVGTNKNIDRLLPKNIISIHKTDNAIEMAKIYSASDVFVNPTREDNFPTVNLESIACGTPVVTFNAGGSGEMLDAYCGRVIPIDDYESLKKEVINLCENHVIKRVDCINKAMQFDCSSKFKEYVNLYFETIGILKEM